MSTNSVASWKPSGYQSCITSVVVDKCQEALDFWKVALGAEVVDCHLDHKTGKVMHGVLKIDDSVLFCNDVFPEMCPTPSSVQQFYVYTPDVDAAHKRAVAAGATSAAEPKDQFWGDRTGAVKDPYGFKWTFSTRKSNPSDADMQKHLAEWEKQKEKEKEKEKEKHTEQ